MANIKPALDILYGLEFSNPSNALHKNKGEHGLTFMGVYQAANPRLSIWEDIQKTLDKYSGDIKKASEELYSSTKIRGQVDDVYRWNYWNKAKLDQLTSQQIANEIFIFGVNAGMRNAIRKAQKVVGAVSDGIVGSQTIKALNEFDEEKFDFMFDELEEQFYDDLIARKPSLKRFKRGWHNRAVAV